MATVPGGTKKRAVSGERAPERLQIRIAGTVQGVGFRPFVQRLATALALCGWVRNDGNGLTIEVEGPHELLLEFVQRLRLEKPPPALIYTLELRCLAPEGDRSFGIRSSRSEGPPRVWILPDLATCQECRSEILNPGDRRFRYPFTNCTHCGPRFSIIRGLPYDRPQTSMSEFEMCPECHAEYRTPEARRFHAQPNACPECGPLLEFRSRDGLLGRGEDALRTAGEWIREGRVLAVKGLGGYHLVADAAAEGAIRTLRRRKRRSHKPFAVMYPSLEILARHVVLSPFAASLLASPQAPILLLERTPRGDREIAPSVAPDSPNLGVFLPYTPLHHLLMEDLKRPVVATSGNLVDEPIQHRDGPAREALDSLCDGFLLHNRPILRPCDDSVLQVLTRPRLKPQMLRRARGYAPLPLLAPRPLPPLLALGGHLNAVFAVSRDREILLSQHLGDLDHFESREAYERVLEDFLSLYQLSPELVVHDLHPDYFTTALASRFGLPRLAVQHHHAHLAACMVENRLEGPVLGLTWDGTGYGPDGTIWGGETLLGDEKSFERVASLYPFRLPGGERAVREPWRVALALLSESFGEALPRDLPLFDAVPTAHVEALLQILRRESLGPVTTSMGRLFDGVSALLGLSFRNTHQAQSAQALEYAAWRGRRQPVSLELPILEESPLRLDWRDLVLQLVAHYRRDVPKEALAAGFHDALVRTALRLAREFPVRRVVLSGGVFCNRYLTEGLLEGLELEGLEAYTHSQLPPTDGSLAVGQLWAASQAAG